MRYSPSSAKGIATPRSTDVSIATRSGVVTSAVAANLGSSYPRHPIASVSEALRPGLSATRWAARRGYGGPARVWAALQRILGGGGRTRGLARRPVYGI